MLHVLKNPGRDQIGGAKIEPSLDPRHLRRRMSAGPPRASRLLALACIAVAGSARGEITQRARLDYVLGPGAEQCPDRARLALLVATHLGYDPFDARAGQRLAVKVDARD